MDCKDVARRLAVLADNVSRHAAELRHAGFTCCHVNDDWIAQHCSASEFDMHQRYLVEAAREILMTGNHSPDLGDDQNCLSPWLNELKATRLRTYGPDTQLRSNPRTYHLSRLSPGWREFMRVRGSVERVDRSHSERQVAEFVRRQKDEIKRHDCAISDLLNRMPTAGDKLSLQAFFAGELVAQLKSFGAHAHPTLGRNQEFNRDEKIIVVIFPIVHECFFVVWPVISLSVASRGLEGSLGVGYRLMSRKELDAPKFDFKAGTVLYLSELMPSDFNGYSRFASPEEFGLNILANTTAVRILLPNALDTLRSSARTDS